MISDAVPGRWFTVERGSGRPLVLVHGIGMSSRVWEPELERLGAERRAIAVDLPGFGQTPPLPADIEPTPAALADALMGALAEIGVKPPFDIAGNSLGGWIGLETAKAGNARSVVALSPNGLWHRAGGLIPFNVRLNRVAARRALPVLRIALRFAPLRPLLMGAGVTFKAWRIPAEAAIGSLEDAAHASDFDRVDRAMHGTRFVGGQAIDVPVTVAFGTQDVLISRRTRVRDELPQQARWLDVRGWGHVPMWDDPSAVAELILEGTR